MIDPVSHPLDDDSFGTVHNGTTGMSGISFIVDQCDGIHIGKEDTAAHLRLDVHIGLLEVGTTATDATTLFRYGTVHDHGSDTTTGFVDHVIAITIAVRRVAIGSGPNAMFIVRSGARCGTMETKILNTHQFFLAIQC